MRYGDNKTIHQTGELNVELGPGGEVVSVWFRCMPLQFTQTKVREHRAQEMRRMYSSIPKQKITAIVLEDNEADGTRPRCEECEGTADAPKFTRRNALFPPALCKNRFHYGEKKQ